MKTIKKSTKLLCLSLVVALVLSVFAPTAAIEAQAVRKVTANYNYKKAPAIKVGTTAVTAKPYKSSNLKTKTKTAVSWVKFTAPKAGTYQFTISNYAKKGNSNAVIYGCVTMMTGKNTYAGARYPKSYLSVKTKGGKVNTLYLRSAASYTSSGSVSKYTYLPSRTATVKLKKGQVVYLDFNNSSTITCNVKVKKK